jgi:hypothetical protein
VPRRNPIAAVVRRASKSFYGDLARIMAVAPGVAPDLHILIERHMTAAAATGALAFIADDKVLGRLFRFGGDKPGALSDDELNRHYDGILSGAIEPAHTWAETIKQMTPRDKEEAKSR